MRPSGFSRFTPFMLSLPMLLLSAPSAQAVAPTSVISAKAADGAQIAQDIASAGRLRTQSQRLAKSVSIAMTGAAPAFADVKDSAGVLARNVRALNSGDTELGVQALGESFQPELEAIAPLVERADRNAAVVMGQQKILTQVGDALRTINRQSSDLLEIAETISSLKLQQNAPASEISAAGQLVMLTQRIGKSANEFQTTEGVSPEEIGRASCRERVSSPV